MKKAYFLALFGALLFTACRRNLEKPSWDVDVVGPVVYTSLGIGDLLPDSLLQSNPDSSVTLVYNNTVYRLDLDTLVNLPDTMVGDTFQLPVFVPSIGVVPNQQLFTITEEKSFSIGDVELTDAILLEGSIEVHLSNTINEPTVLEYQIPTAEKAGLPFSVSVPMPAGSYANPSIVDTSFDLSGYVLNLRGTSGVSYNSYTSVTTIKMSPFSSPGTVTNTDRIMVRSTFTGLKPRYAKGYFGSRLVSVPGESANFDMFRKIISGTLDIDQVDVKMTIRNGLGVDANVILNQIQATNSLTANYADLTHQVIGTNVNINRAVNLGYAAQASTYIVDLNNGNSNIDQILELLPNIFTVGMDVLINPLGDVSGHNDFLYNANTLEADLNITLPLSLIADQLTLVDTIEIQADRGDNGYVSQGKFTVEAKNGFPLEGDLQLYFMDQNGNPTDSVVAQGNLDAGFTNASNVVTSPRISNLVFQLNSGQMDRIYNGERMILKVVFSTSSLTQHVVIYDYYKIDLKLKGDFKYHIEFAE